MPSRPPTPAQVEALKATQPQLQGLDNMLKAMYPNHSMRRRPTPSQALFLFKLWLTCFDQFEDFKVLNITMLEDTPTGLTVRVETINPELSAAPNQ